jgi:hypothetical protein
MKSFLISFLVLGLIVANGALAQFGQTHDVPTNPEISLNGLMLGRLGTDGAARGNSYSNGFHLQEMELRFSSNIDAYFFGTATLAFHPVYEGSHGHSHTEHGPEESEGSDDHHDHYEVDLEEIYVETLALPGFSVRAGKFFALMGRHNELHTHYFPFIDAPLPHRTILGQEGLNEVGVAVSYLVPVPWYLEVVPQVFSAQNSSLFGSETLTDPTGLLFVKNLWDLSDNTTLEWNATGGYGANRFGSQSSLYNTALTFRWRPIEGGIYRSFSWTLEYLYADQRGAGKDAQLGGLTTWAQYQFGRYWWLQGRFDTLNFPAPHDGGTQVYSALLGYLPTEYSALRFQYDWVRAAEDDQSHDHGHGHSEHRLALQLSFSIGAHPAHLY